MEDNDTFRLSHSKINLQKKSLFMDTENGESALRHVRNKVPGDKNKTLGRERNVQGAKELRLATKRK